MILYGLILSGAVALALAFLALLQRLLDKDVADQHEMDAKLNALRDMGGKQRGDWHGRGYL